MNHLDKPMSHYMNYSIAFLTLILPYPNALFGQFPLALPHCVSLLCSVGLTAVFSSLSKISLNFKLGLADNIKATVPVTWGAEIKVQYANF